MRRPIIAMAMTAVLLATTGAPVRADDADPTSPPETPSATASPAPTDEPSTTEPTMTPSPTPSVMDTPSEQAPEPSAGPTPEPVPEASADPSPGPDVDPSEPADQHSTDDGTAVLGTSAVQPLAEVSPPTAHTAGLKLVGLETNTWGRFSTSSAMSVWTEVLTPSGWSTSQIRTTDSAGSFVIPLTYGASTPGTYRWRVAGTYPDGTVARSAEFELWRVARPTLATAGSKPVGQTTNAWGRFDVRAPITVRTEVWLSNRWSTSQIRTTDASGSYVIPLTYGADTPGTYRWRVTGIYSDGTPISSAEATLTRVADAHPSITRTTTAEVSGYWTSSCPVGPSQLSTIRINHWDYSGTMRRGTMIVRQDLASQVSAVLRESFDARFPFAQMRLPSVWGGDDLQMMSANNTSGFNCRKVVGNPYAWSPHAYGIAVDINPRENPYRDPSGTWYPNATYAYSRPSGVTGMLYSTSTPVRAFQARGWRWESGWDWHHFQKVS